MTIPHPNTSNSNSESNASYQLRLATLKDAYEIHAVMDTCFQALEHQDYFICDDLDYVKDILSGHGFAVVACLKNGKIVGNLLVKYPGITEENLGYDVFRNEKDLNRVFHMDSASVLPLHRGHGLEGQMIGFAETMIDTSKYRYSFATVAPENTASLKTLEKCGYRIIVTKEKYNNLMRHVMMKELI